MRIQVLFIYFFSFVLVLESPKPFPLTSIGYDSSSEISTSFGRCLEGVLLAPAIIVPIYVVILCVGGQARRREIA